VAFEEARPLLALCAVSERLRGRPPDARSGRAAGACHGTPASRREHERRHEFSSFTAGEAWRVAGQRTAFARGELPGPYTDADARRYARACLIPAELLERSALDIDHTAAALRVPADELWAARAEYQAHATARSSCCSHRP
jgi:hypothetical protein